MNPLRWIIPAALLFTGVASLSALPAPAPAADTSSYGKQITRTMQLLATSTPEHPNTVRIIIYGQSISQQKWWLSVIQDLRDRYPSANIIAVNRSLGGFASQLLKRPAEHDLYPFYPDLLIFHVYGSDVDYETIIKNTRTLTTAEVCLQTDHVTRGTTLNAQGIYVDDNWTAHMNNELIPSLATKYHCEVIDVRTAWKNYLTTNKFNLESLLADGTHLNDDGNVLMAQLISRQLIERPDVATDPDVLVTDYVVGEDIEWKGNTLGLAFSGNRVDVIPNGEPSGSATVLIDDKKPSTFPSLYNITRPNDDTAKDWPWAVGAIHHITWSAPLVLEDWTVKLLTIDAAKKNWTFQVTGSVTGLDGQGSNSLNFTSTSGRVKISKDDWWITEASNNVSINAGFEIKWHVYPLYSDTYPKTTSDTYNQDYSDFLAKGLTNEHHVLQLTAASEAERPDIKAIRVYRPYYNRAAGNRASFSIANKVITLPKAGGKVDVKVISNTLWTPGEHPDWLGLSTPRFYGSQTITLSVDANPSASARTTNLVVTPEGGTLSPVTLSITQPGPTAAEFFSPTPLTSGWRNTSWGYVYDGAFPFVFHPKVDWIYIFNNTPEGYFFYSFKQAAFGFTGSAYYPYYYVWDAEPGWHVE
ncbi:MAG: BACON domain-containing carbohydrate-binding protein [Verrucomicrobiota bacterium]|nr:BACON domain-containing carbohydrate-binding protein [Verrucomicrobiota bacterium]